MHVLAFLACFYCSEAAPDLWCMREGKTSTAHTTYEIIHNHMPVFSVYLVLLFHNSPFQGEGMKEGIYLQKDTQ